MLPPTAGTGAAASGDDVAVGVLPLIVELTISLVGAAVATGVGAAAFEPNTPVDSSKATPIPMATAAASTGTASRCHTGGGFWSVTRQARGLEVLRLAGARVGTAQR